MPLCCGASGSVRARQMPQSARSATDVHTFWPVSFQPPSTRSAFVRLHPTAGITFSYNAVGSGAGIKNFYGPDARKSTELFGASDAMTTEAERKAITDAVGNYYMVPMALGPVAVVYNLPGLKQRLSGVTTSQNYKKYRAATLFLDGATLGRAYGQPFNIGGRVSRTFARRRPHTARFAGGH